MICSKQLLLGGVRRRRDRDLVQASLLPLKALSRRQVEARERRAADREPRRELHDPGELQPLDWSLGLDADHLADLEVLLGGGLLVDDDLVRARPATFDEREWVERRVGIRDREAEVGRASVDDRLAVVADQLRRLGVDGTLRLFHRRQCLHLGEQGLVEGRLRDTAAVGEVELRLPGDHGIRAGTDVVEDALERLVDRVGEHVGATDHGDAEHDRQSRQRRPQLPAEQAADGEASHYS